MLNIVKPLLGKPLALMLLSWISGCTQTIVIDSACTSFDIIRPSRKDTLETKRQVLIHNTVWRQQCELKNGNR